jgi:hypothetical protein
VNTNVCVPGTPVARVPVAWGPRRVAVNEKGIFTADSASPGAYFGYGACDYNNFPATLSQTASASVVTTADALLSGTHYFTAPNQNQVFSEAPPISSYTSPVASFSQPPSVVTTDRGGGLGWAAVVPVPAGQSQTDIWVDTGNGIVSAKVPSGQVKMIRLWGTSLVAVYKESSGKWVVAHWDLASSTSPKILDSDVGANGWADTNGTVVVWLTWTVGQPRFMQWSVGSVNQPSSVFSVPLCTVGVYYPRLTRDYLYFIQTFPNNKAEVESYAVSRFGTADARVCVVSFSDAVSISQAEPWFDVYQEAGGSTILAFYARSTGIVNPQLNAVCWP